MVTFVAIPAYTTIASVGTPADQVCCTITPRAASSSRQATINVLYAAEAEVHASAGDA
jgi:hypothetical protein